MIFDGSFAVRIICIQRSIKTSEMKTLAVHSNACSPFAIWRVPINAFVARSIIFVLPAILLVLCVRGYSQIASLVIEFIQINVIAFFMWIKAAPNHSRQDYSMHKGHGCYGSRSIPIHCVVSLRSINLSRNPRRLCKISIFGANNRNLSSRKRYVNSSSVRHNNTPKTNFTDELIIPQKHRQTRNIARNMTHQYQLI